MSVVVVYVYCCSCIMRFVYCLVYSVYLEAFIVAAGIFHARTHWFLGVFWEGLELRQQVSEMHEC